MNPDIVFRILHSLFNSFYFHVRRSRHDEHVHNIIAKVQILEEIVQVADKSLDSFLYHNTVIVVSSREQKLDGHLCHAQFAIPRHIIFPNIRCGNDLSITLTVHEIIFPPVQEEYPEMRFHISVAKSRVSTRILLVFQFVITCTNTVTSSGNNLPIITTSDGFKYPTRSENTPFIRSIKLSKNYKAIR